MQSELIKKRGFLTGQIVLRNVTGHKAEAEKEVRDLLATEARAAKEKAEIERKEKERKAEEERLLKEAADREAAKTDEEKAADAMAAEIKVIFFSALLLYVHSNC